MEDIESLWNTSIELDFVELIEAGWDAEIFTESAQRMLGDDWKTKGMSILKKHAPELVERMNALI